MPTAHKSESTVKFTWWLTASLLLALGGCGETSTDTSGAADPSTENTAAGYIGYGQKNIFLDMYYTTF